MDFPELGERYAITREVARGGMAIVYHAHDRTLDREVAVKVLSSESSAALGRERFEREIRLTSRLVHPGIVPLFDSGCFGDRLFYVMPYVDGGTLRTRLDAEGVFTPDEVMAIAIDVAEALAYAHGAGVVHRDLKPENIFCSHGRAMLADFGIAKQAVSGATITETGTFVGSLAYMAPEQADGEAVIDGRADLYSLGCALFELLTGEPPFRGPTLPAYLHQHLTAPVPRVRAKVPATPTVLADAIEAMLAKSPADRPQSAVATLALLRSRPELRSAPERPGPPVAPPPAAYGAESMAACAEGRALFVRSYQGGVGAREKLEYAKALFERARDLDPSNPHALVGLADVHHVMGFRGFDDFRTSTQHAVELRAQALRMAPDLPELHISIGVELLYWKDDFETAGAEFRRAAEGGPLWAEGHRLYGAYLKMAGQLGAALDQMRAGLAIEPKAPALHVGLGDVLMAMGRYAEAMDPLRESLRLNPGYEAALERLEICAARLGSFDVAVDARRALLGIRRHMDRIAAMDADVAALGAAAARLADVRRELAALQERAGLEDPFVDLNVSRQLADYLVLAHAELGEWRDAMDWIERGFYRRPGRLRRVLTDLPFDRRGLAVDPRYARLLRMAGLEALL